MKLPDILTLSRLALAAVLIGLLTATFPYAKTMAFAVFLIASLTDYLDGELARRVYGESAFGKLMDPLTDKVLVCSTFVVFVELQLVSAWLVVLIISREFLVTGLRLLAASRGQVISAGFWGKHKTVSQLLTIIALLAGLSFQDDFSQFVTAAQLQTYKAALSIASHTLISIVAFITILSGAVYFYQHRDLLLAREPHA
ncbi:MAG: CDP-diacylglycerol--glycerol-3-phosphate 3-phosphatidyltransferase [Kiritimatiellaeota bacterium]|nr:CDP-diacylglycerol--glycerol-3-phosphate 3-phosphatidyltransferase [Kiritimatiellota bacterium]